MPLEFYENLLKKLGQTVGIPTLEADKEGYCQLEFDGKYVVHLQYDRNEDAVIFFSQLSEVDPAYRAVAYPLLLKADWHWEESQGATISLNPVTSRIEVAHRFCTCVDYGAFENLLDAFVTTVEKFQKLLDELPLTVTVGEPSRSTSAPEPGAPDFDFKPYLGR